jgi:hypothetical protein
MLEVARTMKEQCANCTATDYEQAHWTGGMLLCDACYRCVAAAKKAAKPPTPAQQRSLLDWIAPHRGAQP